MKTIQIASKQIGGNAPVFIIAELSANHNGNLQTAIDTVKAAKRAGADAIKLQTYTPDTITIDARTDDFLIKQGTIWDGRYLHELYGEAYTPWDWHAKLFEVARQEGLACFSSPFDRTAADFLEKLDTPAYKIASLEITDIPLIEHVAKKNRPIIISTGVADENDIRLALEACYRQGNTQVVLLKCTTSYPAPFNEANLSMIPDMAERFGVIAGLSDHTPGITAAIVATVLGAKLIEKHFIIDRSIGGPDASFSLNEAEFTAMAAAVRETETAIGEVNYSLTGKQEINRAFARSLYVVKDVNAGEEITESNVRSIRPGYGLHPKHLPEILGRHFVRDVKKGERMSFDLLMP
jgi:pseudaminic acid synthase